MINPFQLIGVKKEKPVEKLDTEISTKTIVDQIHNEVYSAQDTLLKEAEEYLGLDRSNSFEKARRLKELGFYKNVETAKYEEESKEFEEIKKLHEVLNNLKLKFPTHKFITHKILKNICVKYGLVFGNVDLYKGFVPNKNLLEIEKFFEQESELTYFYVKQHVEVPTINSTISKEEFYKITDGDSHLIKEGYRYYKIKRQLVITAPLKDMDMRNHLLRDNEIVRESLDPIVLVRVDSFKEDLNLYVIVTAWGDEASDPEILNEKNN